MNQPTLSKVPGNGTNPLVDKLVTCGTRVAADLCGSPERHLEADLHSICRSAIICVLRICHRISNGGTKVGDDISLPDADL
jgi:hypothetical protein